MITAVRTALVVVMIGTSLVLMGLGLWDILAQLRLEFTAASMPSLPSQTLEATPKGFQMSTHFVGLELVGIGATLQIACLVSLSIKRNSS